MDVLIEYILHDFNQVMSGTNNQADWTLYTDWRNTQSAEKIYRHSTRNLDPILQISKLFKANENFDSIRN